jgi:hypothetical protein
VVFTPKNQFEGLFAVFAKTSFLKFFEDAASNFSAGFSEIIFEKLKHSAKNKIGKCRFLL